MDYDQKKLDAFLRKVHGKVTTKEANSQTKLIPLILGSSPLSDLEQLLKNGSSDANEEDYILGSVLLLCTTRGEREFCKTLVNYGANPFHYCGQGTTPFYEAIYRDDIELASYYIENAFEHHFESINDFDFFEIMQTQISEPILSALLKAGYIFDFVDLYRKFPECSWVVDVVKSLDNNTRVELLHYLHYSLFEFQVYGNRENYRKLVKSMKLVDDNEDDIDSDIAC